MKTLVAFISIFCAVNLFAAPEMHIRDGRTFVETSGGVNFAFFEAGDDPTARYAALTQFEAPTAIVRFPFPENPEAGPSGSRLESRVIQSLTAEEADLVLFSIYSRLNLDEVLEQIKAYPRDDFNSSFLMLDMIGKRVATISDKRKIMDFFIDRFQLRQDPCEDRAKVCKCLRDRWDDIRLSRSPLDSCFMSVSIEYADYFFEPKVWDDMKNAISHMFLNAHYFSKPAVEQVLNQKGLVSADVEVLYYIYARSRWGQGLGLGLGNANLAYLKNKLGALHPGIRTLEIQDEILAGNLSPEFARELRNLVEKNYVMAFPIALEYARDTKAWDDVAYYAYRCLKNDVYGLQKQTETLLGDRPSRYFDYLEFLLEGLAQTDAQAAGTLYEFIAALPPTMKQNMWLIRAERILKGIDYDKALAKKAGSVMAEKGFYENPEQEARCREYFEKRLKKEAVPAS